MGDLVLYYHPSGGKFEKQRWKGPYRIIGLQPPNASIRPVNGDARPTTVHLDKLKPFRETVLLPLRQWETIVPGPSPSSTGPEREEDSRQGGEYAQEETPDDPPLRWQRGTTLRKRKPPIYGARFGKA
jgi:hypothetical protein